MAMGIARKGKRKKDVEGEIKIPQSVRTEVFICNHNQNVLGSSSFISGNTTNGGFISFIASLALEGEPVIPERDGTGTTAVLNFLIKESPTMGLWARSVEKPESILISGVSPTISEDQSDEDDVEVNYE